MFGLKNFDVILSLFFIVQTPFFFSLIHINLYCASRILKLLTCSLVELLMRSFVFDVYWWLHHDWLFDRGLAASKLHSFYDSAITGFYEPEYKMIYFSKLLISFSFLEAYLFYFLDMFVSLISYFSDLIKFVSDIIVLALIRAHILF